jgi:hypothetical protein
MTPARFAGAIATVALASGGYVIASAPKDAALTLASLSALAGSAVEARCDTDGVADRIGSPCAHVSIRCDAPSH